jgi:ABC-2 type transport system permease protein
MKALAIMEARLYLRDPMVLPFALALPLVLMLVFGLPDESSRPSADIGGRIPLETVLPSLALSLSFGMLGAYMLPAFLTEYRVRGVLRRLSTTPVSPLAVLVAHLAINLAVAAVAVALVLVLGGAVLGMPMPENVPALVLVLVLGATSLFSLGLLIAAVARDAPAAYVLGALFFFPSLFFAGIWLQKEQMPSTLSRIGDFTPLGAFRESLEAAWTGGSPELLALAVMAVVTVLAGGTAARTFRWE